MNDTPKPIQQLQLKIWLSTSPGEGLFQALKDNEMLFRIWQKAKDDREKKMKEKETNQDLTG